MSIKGMDPRYAYTDNNLGIKINDYSRIRQEFKQEYNAKFTLPKRDTYYSTDKFIQVPLMYAGDDMFNGRYLAHNNVVKPLEPVHKTSSIEKSNQVDFRSGEWIKLGEYNDVTVKLQRNKYGEGVDFNLGIPQELSSKPGQPLNEYERKILEMNRKISDSQHEEIGNVMAAFSEFLKVASDENAVQNVDAEHHKYLILGLEKMGVDLSKPFAINGEEFYLRNDTGKVDYYNIKKFVLREDGHVEIQEAGKDNPSDIWKEMSEKYDVRNATFGDIKEISRQLYDAGQISLFDHAMLTFDPSESPQPIKPNLCLTEANADGKRDWIAEYEARSARDFRTGNMLGYKNNQKVIEILRKLL